ncbi:hypothetical protein GJ496_010382 [Pomphorhynchus laevis]|nr:hypothetical protein GJ496_010382 [Pomphorhynchus laevis]
MALSRPTVTVYDLNGLATSEKVLLPAVFSTPIRPDIVNFVHGQMKLNRRQPYAVSSKAGHQTSAESWGTGRAVARIPRVRGSGSHRSGQGAFGNMCRGGRMFAPTKVWRKWHHKINVNQKRYAMCSAIAGSAVPALVMAKGHVIDNIPELPLVVDDSMESFTKTKEAVKLLRSIGAYADIERVQATKRLRSGRGKMHARKYKMKKGPCIIYSKDDGLTKSFRNIPGIRLMNVNKLDLTKLACGGIVGRFCIWTKSAFSQLDKIYGTWTKKSQTKKNYNLPVPIMFNCDLSLIIQNIRNKGALSPRSKPPKRAIVKKNPLKNMKAMFQLNPYAAVLRRRQLLQSIKNVENKKNKVKDTTKRKLAKQQASKERTLAKLREEKRKCVGVSSV